MNTNEQLKPCPFCGSEKTYFIAIDGDYQIECACCYAKSHFYDTKDDVIEAWNRRANDA